MEITANTTKAAVTDTATEIVVCNLKGSFVLPKILTLFDSLEERKDDFVETYSLTGADWVVASETLSVVAIDGKIETQ